jgi:hypothetical protein
MMHHRVLDEAIEERELDFDAQMDKDAVAR